MEAPPSKTMPEYCEVALPVPLPQTFYYSVPTTIELQPGMRVIVPFGARKLIAVVMRTGIQPEGVAESAIKPVQQAIDDEPSISAELLRLGEWIADYYIAPIGEVFSAMLPRKPPVTSRRRLVLTPVGDGILHQAEDEGTPPDELAVLRRIAKRGGIRVETLSKERDIVRRLRSRGWISAVQSMEGREDTVDHAPILRPQPMVADRHELNPGQNMVLGEVRQRLDAGKFGVILLHGVTGSGKTEVYMRSIELSLERGRPALMLVPEISLTPATAGLFHGRFGERVSVLHSGMTDNERAAQWQRVKTGLSDVVIATRSGVFAPLSKPGIVIVDEEHDGSYKQEEAPRYNGRDTAIMRARDAGATVILGSATPAVESRHNADSGRYQLLELDSRVRDRPLPETFIVDMRTEFAETGKKSIFSRRLEEELGKRLEQREQSLILMNRRGYSAFVLCRSCGKTVECSNCSIALTHHQRLSQLLCHYCGFARPVPKVCPECNSEYLYFMGEGSEQIEEMLHHRFPEARIGRLDRDTASRRGSADAILAAFRNHEFDILVGTQMIAKGHDVHRVTLVGVINADMGLARPDFRSAERSFQLLTQVAGRAGRGDLPGEVVIQSFFPEHYAIQSAAAQNYIQFYEKELRFRQMMHYPPFAVLANIVVRSPNAETALKLTGWLGRHLEKCQNRQMKILGPAAAPIHKLKKDYRYHFLMKASSRRTLHDVLNSCRDFAQAENFPATSLVIDVDPQSFS